MSKAVMISIKPKWVELIASGRKTVEVRKTRPKIDVPFKCYIYCTKAKNKDEVLTPCNNLSDIRNGTVIGEFVCDRIGDYVEGFSFNSEKVCISLRTQACLTHEEVWDYSGGKDLYGWHISNLKMYDKPKELSWFWSKCGKEYCTDNCLYFKKLACVPLAREHKILRAPQSYCFVEELEE